MNTLITAGRLKLVWETPHTVCLTATCAVPGVVMAREGAAVGTLDLTFSAGAIVGRRVFICTTVGSNDGSTVVTSIVGSSEGIFVGFFDGNREGRIEGFREGSDVGPWVGGVGGSSTALVVGPAEGSNEGSHTV